MWIPVIFPDHGGLGRYAKLNFDFENLFENFKLRTKNHHLREEIVRFGLHRKYFLGCLYRKCAPQNEQLNESYRCANCKISEKINRGSRPVPNRILLPQSVRHEHLIHTMMSLKISSSLAFWLHKVVYILKFLIINWALLKACRAFFRVQRADWNAFRRFLKAFGWLFRNIWKIFPQRQNA